MTYLQAEGASNEDGEVVRERGLHWRRGTGGEVGTLHKRGSRSPKHCKGRTKCSRRRMEGRFRV